MSVDEAYAGELEFLRWLVGKWVPPRLGNDSYRIMLARMIVTKTREPDTTMHGRLVQSDAQKD